MEKKVLGIHHIALRAKEFDKTIAFYTQVLGFTHYLGWGDPGRRIALLDVVDGTRMEVFEADYTEPQGGFWHLALNVPDPDSLYAAALEAGCTEHIAPKDALLKGEFELPVRLAFVKGLSGEILEFFHPLEG